MMQGWLRVMKTLLCQTLLSHAGCVSCRSNAPPALIVPWFTLRALVERIVLF